MAYTQHTSQCMAWLNIVTNQWLDLIWQDTILKYNWPFKIISCKQRPIWHYNVKFSRKKRNKKRWVNTSCFHGWVREVTHSPSLAIYKAHTHSKSGQPQVSIAYILVTDTTGSYLYWKQSALAVQTNSFSLLPVFIHCLIWFLTGLLVIPRITCHTMAVSRAVSVGIIRRVMWCCCEVQAHYVDFVHFVSPPEYLNACF